MVEAKNLHKTMDMGAIRPTNFQINLVTGSECWGRFGRYGTTKIICDKQNESEGELTKEEIDYEAEQNRKSRYE